MIPVKHHYTGEEFVWTPRGWRGPTYKDVEVATISSNISAIGKSAFSHCSKLHTITIPNNIQTIGMGAFRNCTSLTSISIPISVTSIERGAFSDCTNLTNINFPPSSNLTTIEGATFSYCSQLTSISLPPSVTTIKDFAFYLCSNLININIPPFSNLTTIGIYAFARCSRLTSISLPPSLTTIETGAFCACSELQMITLPKYATVGDLVFTVCSMLKRSNQPDIVTWLKTRYDDLPLHQLCYNINDATTGDISSIQINNQALRTQDALGMTPIHVLISNPSATPDMIRQLVSNDREAAQIRNINGKTPLQMYLDQIECPQQLAEVLLVQDGADYDIYDIIDLGLEYKVIDVVLTLSGRHIGEELNKYNEATGLYPFMSAAMSTQFRLTDVYMMRKESLIMVQENNKPSLKE